jgi:DNA primase
MAFAPQFLDEIRQRVSLAGVVGRRVKLTKRGRDYIGLCPFHKEKTPSFNVVEDKSFFHCFGCGAHGDAIGFTMRVENLAFREAVEQLARQAGLELPVETPAARAEAARAATLHEACQAASAAFEAQLWGPSGAHALGYLRSRGLGDELIRKFRLGWAPDSRNFLKGALGDRFPEALLVEAGLVRQGEHGAFDFFRGRVMFPIFDRSGRVIAFGGRLIGEGQPKYLNSPDTPIFHKGRTLYGFHVARAAVTAEAPPIVAEGYMDVIALHGAGFATAVAPLGTALTEEHLNELWALADHPLICFDGDAAGWRAAIRTMDRALPRLSGARSARFVVLPEKEDPDSLIRSGGPEAFRSVLRTARPLSEFLWESSVRNVGFSSVENLIQLENALRKRIAAVPDRTALLHLNRFVSDRIYELSKRLRRWRPKDPSLDPAVGHRLDARLSKPRDTRLIGLLLAGAIAHPDILVGELDHFIMVLPPDAALAGLLQEVVRIAETVHELDHFRLKDELDKSRFADLVSRVLDDDLYLAHPALGVRADPAAARETWSTIFARLRLPALEADLEECLARYAAETTEESWTAVELRRKLVAEYRAESHRMAELEKGVAAGVA